MTYAALLKNTNKSGGLVDLTPQGLETLLRQGGEALETALKTIRFLGLANGCQLI